MSDLLPVGSRVKINVPSPLPTYYSRWRGVWRDWVTSLRPGEERIILQHNRTMAGYLGYLVSLSETEVACHQDFNHWVCTSWVQLVPPTAEEIKEYVKSNF